MEMTELRKKSTDELLKELSALSKERFNLRIQKGMGQPPGAQLMKKVKINIARIKMLLREKGTRV